MRNLMILIALVTLLSGCSRWSVERYDAETAKRIDAQVPVGMTMREFRDEFPDARKMGDDADLVSINDICFWCYSGRGFVRSEQVFARVVRFEGDRVSEVQPLPGVKP